MSVIQGGDRIRIKSIRSFRNTERVDCESNGGMSLLYNPGQSTTWLLTYSRLVYIAGKLTRVNPFSTNYNEMNFVNDSSTAYVSDQITEEICQRIPNPS